MPGQREEKAILLRVEFHFLARTCCFFSDSFVVLNSNVTLFFTGCGRYSEAQWRPQKILIRIKLVYMHLTPGDSRLITKVYFPWNAFK